MAYKATTSPTGLVSNLKVKCSGCAATLFVHPDNARANGGWECPHCTKQH